MDKKSIAEFLKGIVLFKSLSDNELNQIANIVDVKDFKPNELLFHENTERENLIVIYEGEIELFKKTPFNKEKTLRIFTKFDFLSEGALLDNYPHSTSSKATLQTRVFLLSRYKFNELIKTETQIGLRVLSEISKVISRRMRLTTNQVVGASAQYASGRTRTEHDLLGEREVPFEQMYGVQTLRAIENFNISGIQINHFPTLIKSLAEVKMAAAKANNELGLLSDEICNAIIQSCQEIINGKYHTHFAVDMIQGGAGTSTNMNANEVIANRALELMGKERGQYEFCHPNNHVNMSQSTNDVYPTALMIAFIYQNHMLIEGLLELIESFKNKAEEFAHVIKMGRTQLQDAVPMTLGQEFGAYASTLEEEVSRLNENSKLFLEVNLGGTAIGTGINADPQYASTAIKHLREITGLELETASNLVEATQDTGPFVMYSSAVKRLAIKLSKICNDLRLLSSGPRAGFNEINLPKRQPGSSIMPGKVNPVIPEVVNQIAFKVIGNDITITMAAEAGQLQLNVMEPIIAQSLFESMEILKNGMQTLKYRCIDGITANEDVCKSMVANSIGLVTALVPAIGYEASSKVAKAALAEGKSVYDLVLEMKYLTKEKLDEFLKPENMISPHINK